MPPPIAELAIDVSVLAPVLDEADHIRETVAAMRNQRFDGSIEFLFADGGSRDGTKAILEELAVEDPRIRVFDNPRRVTPSGLNVCLTHARGEFVARMDGHAVYPKRYLALGVDRLRRGGTSWVSGPQIPVGTNPVGRAVAMALETPLGQGGSRKWKVLDLPDPGEESEFELDTGVFAGVWRRDTVMAYGGWDERWPLNQDSEMAARFLRDGEVLLCVPAMAAKYVPRSSLRALGRQYRRYGMYRARTARRHPESLRRSHVLAPGFAVTAVVAAIGPSVLRRPARAALAVYGAVLLTASCRAGTAGRRRAATLLPAVLITMHAGHGVGFLQGCMRFGVPWRALARVATLSRLVVPLPAERDEVWAPSLDASS
jgi:glycosyltransferase involved in cell wall biosynthesis